MPILSNATQQKSADEPRVPGSSPLEPAFCKTTSSTADMTHAIQFDAPAVEVSVLFPPSSDVTSLTIDKRSMVVIGDTAAMILSIW